MCLGTWSFPSASGGLPPRLLPPSGGLGSLPGAWGAPNKGNADGAEGIFDKLRARVGYGPAPGPTQKRPCAIHARKVGRASNTADHSRSEPLQVSGSASAGRVICGTDLAKCVSVPGDFLRPQGAIPPGFYLLREGWVHCPAPEAPLTRGMPTGPRVFLTNSGRVWATALRPVPPKKRPCAIHARKVGRASNTADHSRSEPLQVSGSASAGCVICGTDLAKCVSVPGDFLRPQGAIPPGFYLFREGWVHCPAPEAPLTRGMPKGLRVFLTNSGRVWATALRPVPPKKGLVPYMPVRWGVH